MFGWRRLKVLNLMQIAYFKPAFLPANGFVLFKWWSKISKKKSKWQFLKIIKLKLMIGSMDKDRSFLEKIIKHWNKNWTTHDSSHKCVIERWKASYKQCKTCEWQWTWNMQIKSPRLQLEMVRIDSLTLTFCLESHF